MRKTLVFSACLSLLTCTLHAQSFTLKLGVGYNVPSGGGTMNEDGLPYSGSAVYDPTYGFTSFDIKKASFSSGGELSLGGCLLFNENFGVTLDAHFVLLPVKYTSDSKYLNSSNDNVNQNTTTYAQNPLWLTPAAYLQHNWKKISVYARAGVALPIGIKIIKESRVQYTTASTNVTDYITAKEEIKTKFGVGMAGAMGVKLKLAPYTHLWIEGNFLSMSLYPAESEYVQYDVNGTNYVNSLPRQLRNTSYSLNGGEPVLPARPIPFGNAGISAGISMDF